MSRNLVICCDGTSNEFGVENTNVVRLVQVLKRDPLQQLLYYDPGVGTLPEPGWVTWLGKKLSQVYGLAFGGGLSINVQEAYSFLMETWKPGDQVFLFGFSRGAYTVRVLAGLLHCLGLLPRGNDNLVPYVMRLYKAVRKSHATEHWKLCDDFRWTFARPFHEGDDERRFRVHFLGVWDTVSSVGWVWNPKQFPFTAKNPSIDTVRHAVSIDERRCFFRQNLLYPTNGQDVQQQWFPGVHCDVGGGYPEMESGLWRQPFEWILGEAEHAGLQIDPVRRHTVLNRTAASAKPWTDRQHESLTGLWWLAEFFPKFVHRSGVPVRLPQLGLGRHRHILGEQSIHKTTLLRIREKPDYNPANFSKTFLTKIRSLLSVPDSISFEQ